MLYQKASLHSANVYERLALLSYLIFYGLRGYMFTDIFQYHEFFESINDFEFKWSYSEFNFEPGYVLCNIIIHYFGSSPFFFQFVWTLIDVIFLYFILKYETGPYFLLAFAFLVPLFDGIQINMLRNVKGILLFYFALRYIRERNFAKYFVCVLLGTLIHISTALLLPFYFFINRKMRLIMIGLSVLSIVLYFSDLSILNIVFTFLSAKMGGKVEDVATSYMNSTTGAGLTLGFLYRMFILMFLLLKYDRLGKYNLILLNLAILYICCNTAFNSILIMRDRLSSLFAIGIIGILPYIKDVIKQKPIKRVFVAVNIVCLLGFVYNPHSNIVAKYSNFLTGVEDRKSAESRINSYIVNHER
ncbi:EpsG family protein [Prevotella sp. ne3005]|nr:EpsG family protein [Prevotella sp. ne3005]SEM54211.1 EpsG family protein [Prevotella sp. ne3005]